MFLLLFACRRGRKWLAMVECLQETGREAALFVFERARCRVQAAARVMYSGMETFTSTCRA